MNFESSGNDSFCEWIQFFVHVRALCKPKADSADSVSSLLNVSEALSLRKIF